MVSTYLLKTIHLSKCQELTNSPLKAVGMGSANQFRAIGSTLLVAVTTALFNGLVFPRLSELGISDPNRVIETYSHGGMTGIPAHVWNDARRVLSEGYNRQMYALVACGVAQAAVSLLLWEKRPAATPVGGGEL